MDPSLPPPMPAARRRELARQARDAFPPMGVYAIRNLATGSVQVLASRNVPGAINRARFELQNHGCRNRQLQADWDRYGAEAIRFETLELVRERTEADFDYEAELQVLLELWRTELEATR